MRFSTWSVSAPLAAIVLGMALGTPRDIPQAALPIPPPDIVLTDGGDATSNAELRCANADCTQGALVFHHGSNGNSVLRVVFSPNGRYVFAGRYEGELDTWDTQTWQRARTIVTGQDGIGALAVSADSRYVATGASDGPTVRVWDVQTGKPTAEYKGYKELENLAFSPDGRMLAASANDTRGVIYDLSRGIKVKKLPAWDVAFIQSGNILIATRPRDLSFWDVRSWKVVRRLDDPDMDIWTVVVDEANNRLATAGHEHGTKIWDLSTGEMLKQLDSGFTFSVCPGPNWRWAITSGNNTLRLWSIESGKQVCASPIEGGLDEVSLSRDGHWLAAAVSDRIHIWDTHRLLEACGMSTQNNEP